MRNFLVYTFAFWAVVLLTWSYWDRAALTNIEAFNKFDAAQSGHR